MSRHAPLIQSLALDNCLLLFHMRTNSLASSQTNKFHVIIAEKKNIHGAKQVQDVSLVSLCILRDRYYLSLILPYFTNIINIHY